MGKLFAPAGRNMQLGFGHYLCGGDGEHFFCLSLKELNSFCFSLKDLNSFQVNS